MRRFAINDLFGRSATTHIVFDVVVAVRLGVRECESTLVLRTNSREPKRALSPNPAYYVFAMFDLVQ